MDGVKIGHYTNKAAGTGASVFIFENKGKGAYWVCGSSPATHELVVLDPDNSVANVDGLVLAGGSAYGLYAAQGMMTYLTEQGMGHATPHGVVPIVPAAAIYDLAFKEPTPPAAVDVYAACKSAIADNTATGRIGAGTGATVGKLIPTAKHMSGGLGRAELKLENGLQVLAYAVVNCVGDVRDTTGQIIAGARDEKGFADCERYLLDGKAEQFLFEHTNTTLVAVFTNGDFSKSELKRIAKMATAGLARAISPIFTRYDGDIVFCISIGRHAASELTTGTMAAEAVRLAIINAVQGAEIVS